MTQPYIEYHFATHRQLIGDGQWHFTWKEYPVGTTFAQVKQDWAPDDPTFTPMRLRWPSYVWPGGYELVYMVKDGGILCHQCANKEMDRTLDKDDEQFFIIDVEPNYEDPHLQCDHCNRQIKSAYGEDA